MSPRSGARLPMPQLPVSPLLLPRFPAFPGLLLGTWKGGVTWADLGAGRTALEGARPRVASPVPLASLMPLATSMPTLNFPPSLYITPSFQNPPERR